MTIPSTGPIKLRGDGDGRGINEEENDNITDTNVSLGALSTSAGFSSPDAMRYNAALCMEEILSIGIPDPMVLTADSALLMERVSTSPMIKEPD